MRIIRFTAQSKVKYGLLTDGVVQGIQGSPFTRFKSPAPTFKLDDSVYNLNDVRLLAPCLPSKIVCIGLNYRKHAEEVKLPIPTVPLIFIKPSTAIIAPYTKIMLPHHWKRIDYEGELAIVIGNKTKDVSESQAKNHILGYTCFNDVSDRQAQRDDGQWTRSKSYDTFAPIGPWIETDIDPDDLKIETRLNNELRQSARTSDFIFGVSKIVSFISGIMTLLPGDVIASGTPSGIGPMEPGDMVEVTIEKIGTLRNFVQD